MEINFKPLEDRILVRVVEAETITEGGIYIPEGAGRERTIRGYVLAVGEGITLPSGDMNIIMRKSMITKPGDTVIFIRTAGVEVIIDGSRYIIVRESDVLGVI